MWPNAWVAAVAFAGAMPLLAALAVVAWLGALLPGAHLEARRSGLPSAFFAAFLAEAAPRCGPPPDSTCEARESLDASPQWGSQLAVSAAADCSLHYHGRLHSCRCCNEGDSL